MTTQQHDKLKPEETIAEGTASVGKKPYVKPAFRFERVFETRALACGKVHATQASCQHNRRTS